MFVRAIAICALAAAMGFTHARLKPLTISFGSAAEPGGGLPQSGPASGPAAQKKPLRDGYIDIETARGMLDLPDVVFVDARIPDEYKVSRLARAQHLPPDVFWTGEMPEFCSNMPREWRYVIYCKSDQCDAAELVAVRLKEYGYANLLIMQGGFEAWTKAGFPLEGRK